MSKRISFKEPGMDKVLKQTMIGIVSPMVLFVLLILGSSFISQEALWRDNNFWLIFRLYVCCSLFIGFCRGFFTYLEINSKESKNR